MKMTTLRDQSKPILYGLVVLFILAMGNFGNVFSSTNPNRGTSEFCDPNLFVACSDDGKISISLENFNQRFNSNIDFWLSQATFNSQFSAIDKQLDTLNAKSRVYNSLLNEQINNKFISELNLSPQKNYSDEMMSFIKNYPNFNSTYKLELESYNLFMVDSVFNQEQYELAVDNGTIDDIINENFELNNLNNVTHKEIKAFSDDFKHYSFPEFGLFIWRNSKDFFSIRCGDIGQNGVGGHSHYDQLSIECFSNNKWIARDPGTGTYTDDIKTRNKYRSLDYHWGPKAEMSFPQEDAFDCFKLNYMSTGKVLKFDKFIISKSIGSLVSNKLLL